MMTIAQIVEQIAARGAAAAETTVAKLAAALITVAEAELPGVAATREDAGVVLQGHGLRARALGTRRHAADPRLAGLVALLRSQQVPR